MSRRQEKLHSKKRGRDRDAEIDQTGELSQYEIERRRTMERNHRKLQELGLVAPDETKTESVPCPGGNVSHTLAQGDLKAPAHAPARKPYKRGSQSRTPNLGAQGGKQAIVPRRSLRNLGRTAPIHTENAVGFDDDNSGKLSRKSRRPTAPRHPASQEDQLRPQLRPLSNERRGKAKRPSLAPDSSRNLECDVARLMREYLGRRFKASGKATVMDLATRSHPPKFSRMSGVTEWENAIFLWVNVGDGGGYTNLFEGKRPRAHELKDSVTSLGSKSPARHSQPRTSSESPGEDASCIAEGAAGLNAQGEVDIDNSARSGLWMTWYASVRMTPESALVDRLLASRRMTDMKESNTADVPVTATGLPEESTAMDTECARAGNSPGGGPVDVTKTGHDNSAASAKRDAESPGMSIASERRSSAREGAREVEPENGSEGSGDTNVVLLFCRLVNEPYVFCGRLGYEAHWPSKQPMQFSWRLLDTDRLARYPDFAAILEAASVPDA